MDDRHFVIGAIAGTHGIKGVLKVFPTTFDPTRFELLKSVTVRHKGELKEFSVDSVGYHKKFVLLGLKEISDVNIAEGYKGDEILISEENALPLGDDEYYRRDLYGMRVITLDGEALGTINEIYETGANDVYGVINEDNKELLIPAIKQCILKVDIKSGEMLVKLLEGLRD